MRVMARQYNFYATINSTDSGKYRLTVLIGTRIQHPMTELYSTFTEANSELHRVLGLIIREKSNER